MIILINQKIKERRYTHINQYIRNKIIEINAPVVILIKSYPIFVSENLELKPVMQVAKRWW